MKILVNINMSDVLKEKLKMQLPEHEILYSKSFTDADFESANVLFGNFNSKKIKLCKDLKLIQSSYSGVDKYCTDSEIDDNIPICSATGAFGAEIAEMMLSMVLALKKNLLVYRDAKKGEIWNVRTYGKPLSGNKVLILGLGDIGSSFAKLLKPFGCHIVGIKRNILEKPDCVNEIFTTEKLNDIIPEFDVVAMCLPHTTETVGIMSRECILKMKKGSILVNAGRGSTADTDAIYDALSAGILGGAALDVTNPEPLPENHPLLEMENVLITPHIAGMSDSPYIIEAIIDIFIANFEALLENKPLITPVDKSSGYMKSRG